MGRLTVSEEEVARGGLPAALMRLQRWWFRRWPFRRFREPFCRLAEFLSRLGIFRPQWREFAGLTLLADPGNHLGQCLLGAAEYQPEVCKAIVDLLPPGGTFVDVGANVGFTTMLGARRVGDAGRVFAFEPSPRNAEILRQQLARNHISNVTVSQAGCWDRPGELPLFIAPDRDMGKTSLSAANAGSRRAVPVEVAPLEDHLAKHHLDRLDLIKIDVEGAELQVLAGAREVLRRFRPTLLVEVDARLLKSFGTTPAQLNAFLKEAGYGYERLTETDIVARPLAD